MPSHTCHSLYGSTIGKLRFYRHTYTSKSLLPMVADQESSSIFSLFVSNSLWRNNYLLLKASVFLISHIWQCSSVAWVYLNLMSINLVFLHTPLLTRMQHLPIYPQGDLPALSSTQTWTQFGFDSICRGCRLWLISHQLQYHNEQFIWSQNQLRMQKTWASRTH